MSQPKPESDPSPSLPGKPSVSVSDSEHSHSSDYAPYPKLGPDDTAPALPDDWASRSTGPEPSAPISGEASTTLPPESNPYVSPAPAPVPASASVKNKIGSVKEVIGNFGKKAAEATKMAEDLAGNMWQHLKTGPSVTDAAVGRITQGTKVLTEGGYEKIFRQTFEVVPDEQLVKAYACYLFTSTGPIMGTLYLSTAKLAFCSDKPLSFKENEQAQWCYYKVVLPISQLKAVNPSTSKINPAEKYIQVISLDNHEFWFMGFVSYDSAVKKLQEVLQHSTSSAHHETLVP